jgi:hypothetical protein
MLQQSGLKRNTIDKFYTKEIVVRECCEIIQENITIDRLKDLIIEPSAGSGAFLQELQKMCSNTLFTDIEPDSPLVVKSDFLKSNYTTSRETYNNIHVIGNPPFGRQSSLAIKFIRHSATFCDTISFILPKSFKKESMKKKISLYFHCVVEKDIQQNAFTLGTDNKSFHVPCVFQIWEKKSFQRKLPPIRIPRGFKFVKEPEDADISFRRVGAYAGKIDDDDIYTKSKQSHYFIKFSNDLTGQQKEQLKQIQFKSSNCVVGPKSISKQELIKEFNITIDPNGAG